MTPSKTSALEITPERQAEIIKALTEEVNRAPSRSQFSARIDVRHRSERPRCRQGVCIAEAASFCLTLGRRHQNARYYSGATTAAFITSPAERELGT
jgi:hypothetical protein